MEIQLKAQLMDKFLVNYRVTFNIRNLRFLLIPSNLCGDQLLVNSLYITNLYKQDAVSVTRLQCICGILDFELSIIAFKSI